MRFEMANVPSNDHVQRYATSVAALNQGDWMRAQHLSMHLLRDAPPHAGVCFVAGVAALQLQQLSLAVECLRRAVAINPARADYMAQLARALSQARMPTEAIEAADKARALAPSDAMTLDTLGVVYSQVNAHANAAAMFKSVVALQPDRASYRFNLATSLVFSGDVAAAEGELEACLGLDPGFWKAHLTLAQLRKQTPCSNHIDRLRALLARVPEDDATAQLYLHLALSKEHEDLGQYPQAFIDLALGKSAGRRGRDYSSMRDQALFDTLREWSPVAQPGTSGFSTREPIFIFGMPRTGTTLVERIISSLPQVHPAGELQNFSVTLKRMSGSTTPEIMDIDTFTRARHADWKALGRHYLSSTRPLTGHTPHFIDKLPHNFLYAGFIAKALPDAKLICLRRNPMDTCLGNFRQLFAQTSPYYDYSFDLLDAGRYYIMFDRLMAHWQRVFPGRILEIDYESIVDAQEASSRRLLAHCGLPWDEACMRFEQNAAPVSTASALQVRAPIYRSALQRWKRYEPQLEELRALLADAGIAVGD